MKRDVQKNPAEHLEHTSDLVNAEGLCARFPFPSTRTVNEMRRQRKLPCIKLGYRSYLYSVSAVAAALARLEIKEIGRPK